MLSVSTVRRFFQPCTAAAAVSLALLAATQPAAAQPATVQPDKASVLRSVDAAVQARVDSVLGFTDVEHYSVFRGHDEVHPVAQMTVRVTYTKGAGKSYQILSQSGSQIIQRFGLRPLLDNEKNINRPGNIEKSQFTSANFKMQLKPGEPQHTDGRDCYALAITPLVKAPNMVRGTLWVDAQNGSIVRVEGVASKSPSVFAGTTHMMREYINIDGFPMASHARAESSSLLFGHTVVTIDYRDYHLQLRPAH